jgi:hypothetical protein
MTRRRSPRELRRRLDDLAGDDSHTLACTGGPIDPDAEGTVYLLGGEETTLAELRESGSYTLLDYFAGFGGDTTVVEERR